MARNHHWSLVVADFTTFPTVSVTHSDPADGLHHEGSPNSITRIQQFIINHWNWRTSNSQAPTRSLPHQWRLHVVPSTQLPQQRDNVSCGLYVIWYALSMLLCLPINSLLPNHLPRLRNHIAYCLLYHILPEPYLTEDSGCADRDLEPFFSDFPSWKHRLEEYEASIRKRTRLQRQNTKHGEDGQTLSTAIHIDCTIPSSDLAHTSIMAADPVEPTIDRISHTLSLSCSSTPANIVQVPAIIDLTILHMDLVPSNAHRPPRQGLRSSVSTQETLNPLSLTGKWLSRIRTADCPEILEAGIYLKDQPPHVFDLFLSAIRMNPFVRILHLQNIDINDYQLHQLTEVLMTSPAYALNIGEAEFSPAAIKQFHDSIASTFLVQVWFRDFRNSKLRDSILRKCEAFTNGWGCPFHTMYEQCGYGNFCPPM